MYDELIKNLRDYAEVYKFTDNENTLEYSLLIKAADAIEKLSKVRKGKWELNAPDDFIVYCSECMMPQDSPCNYCPSCGADMR